MKKKPYKPRITFKEGMKQHKLKEYEEKDKDAV